MKLFFESSAAAFSSRSHLETTSQDMKKKERPEHWLAVARREDANASRQTCSRTDGWSGRDAGTRRCSSSLKLRVNPTGTSSRLYVCVLLSLSLSLSPSLSLFLSLSLSLSPSLSLFLSLSLSQEALRPWSFVLGSEPVSGYPPPKRALRGSYARTKTKNQWLNDRCLQDDNNCSYVQWGFLMFLKSKGPSVQHSAKCYVAIFSSRGQPMKMLPDEQL